MFPRLGPVNVCRIFRYLDSPCTLLCYMTTLYSKLPSYFGPSTHNCQLYMLLSQPGKANEHRTGCSMLAALRLNSSRQMPICSYSRYHGRYSDFSKGIIQTLNTSLPWSEMFINTIFLSPCTRANLKLLLQLIFTSLENFDYLIKVKF